MRLRRTPYSLIMMATLIGIAACKSNTPTATNTGGGGSPSGHTSTPTPAPNATGPDVSASSGHNPVGFQPSLAPTTSASASAGATGAAASPGASTAASPTPLGTPTPVVDSTLVVPPSTLLAAGDVHQTEVTGKVYDLLGNIVEGANVEFKSDDGLTDKTFNASDIKDPLAGAYTSVEAKGAQLSDLPPGGYVVTATGFSNTPRSRHISLLKGTLSTINFGSPTYTTNQPEDSFGVTNFPEISNVTVGADPSNVDGTQINMSITISSPIQGPQVDTFLNSLVLLPMNSVAAATSTTPPDLNAKDSTAGLTLANFPYTVLFPSSPGPMPAADASFYGQILSYTWPQLFQTLQITWGLPLQNGPTTGGKYQLAMISPTASAIIQDSKYSHLLGMNEAFDHAHYSTANYAFIDKAFVSPQIGPTTFDPSTVSSRWTSTHVNAFQFQLAPDAAAPQLSAVTAGAGTLDPISDGIAAVLPALSTQISLTFNKMLVCLGSGGSAPLANQPPPPNAVIHDKSVLVLSNYTFAAGQSNQYLLQTTHLNGGASGTLLPETSDKVGFGPTGSTTELGTEFSLTSTTSPVDIHLLGADAHTVHINWNNPNFFFYTLDPSKLNQDDLFSIRARAVNITDTAGNTITTQQADNSAQQPVGTLTLPVPTPTPGP